MSYSFDDLKNEWDSELRPGYGYGDPEELRELIENHFKTSYSSRFEMWSVIVKANNPRYHDAIIDEYMKPALGGLTDSQEQELRNDPEIEY